MGGNALSRYGVKTNRLNTEDFYIIGNSISAKLSSDLGLISQITKSYHTKETHGDLDLLIKVTDQTNVDYREYITREFKPQAIYSNAGVHSFDYKDFQVDFIPIIETKWDSALVYFSYDPLGNIMGKTFHKFGLSYGWEGLYYKYRNSDGRNSQDILVSNDVRKIFEFGGYDYDRYLNGFETLEDIYQYIIDCKYFNSTIFQLESLSATDRKRNRKRKSYHEFIAYLSENNIVKEYEFAEKASYLPAVVSFFPQANLMQKIDVLKKRDIEYKIISTKFNGDMVMMWLPKLMGKELGNAMSKFKNSFGDDYNDFILNSSYGVIKKEFMRIYNDNE